MNLFTLCRHWGAAECGRGDEQRATSPILFESDRAHKGDASGDVQRSGEGVRGQRRTPVRCSRGASDGAEEAAHGHAVHTGMSTHGEDPSPGARLKQRYPAKAHAVHGEGRVGWSNAQERVKVCGPGEGPQVLSPVRCKSHAGFSTEGMRKRAGRNAPCPYPTASLRLLPAPEAQRSASKRNDAQCGR
jgi:hypothetical protein